MFRISTKYFIFFIRENRKVTKIVIFRLSIQFSRNLPLYIPIDKNLCLSFYY